MRTRAAASPMLALAIASPVLLLSMFSSFVAADGVAKLPSGTNPGAAFMPFAFGGVHTQKERSPAYLEEATEPRYVVEVSSIPEKKKTEGGGKEEEGSASPPPSPSAKARAPRIVSLADRAGRPFECTVPAAPAAALVDTDGTPTSASGGGEEGDRGDDDAPSPVALLRSLEGSCLYRVEDSWWTYELCFERHVRQFHREASPGFGGMGGGGGVSSEFWLGRWLGGSGGGAAADPAAAAPSSPPAPSSSPSGVPPSSYNVSVSNDRSALLAERGASSSSFVSSTYAGGDPCDLLGGKPRRTEVRFVCHERPAPTAAPQPPTPEGAPPPPPAAALLVQPPPNVILSAKEISTCSYEVVVGVDALCRHGGFRAAEPATATIECRPVVVTE